MAITNRSGRATAGRWFGILNRHPASVGETYSQHMRAALAIAVRSLWIATAAVLHAFVPALCEHTAGDALGRLHADVAARRAGATPGHSSSSSGADRDGAGCKEA